jgi:arylsulfatase A-like enzyme
LGGKPTPNRAFREVFADSGLTNDFMVEVARRAVHAEGLGQDLVPDLLLLGLSSNDYVGHDYGPHSAEIMDTYVRTDRALARLFGDLDRLVPGGMDNVLVVVTADHGVAGIPELLGDTVRASGGRVQLEKVTEAVDAALDKAFGPGDWVKAYTRTDPNLYLDQALIAERKLQPELLELAAARAAMTAPGVYWALTRTQVMSGQLPGMEWARAVALGFHPQRSGDLVVVLQPGYLPEVEGTGHGTPWPYDSHVPIVLRGPGVAPGHYLRRVTTMDLAPTLSQLLGVAYPNGCLGQPLAEALQSR